VATGTGVSNLVIFEV